MTNHFSVSWFTLEVLLVILENSICPKFCIIGQSFMLWFLLAKYSSHCLSYSLVIHTSLSLYIEVLSFFYLIWWFLGQDFSKTDWLKLMLLRELSAWPGLLEAWLVLTSVKYHGNLYNLIPLNQRLALTRLRATGPWCN